MPIILKHPNSNANYGAPKDWNEELNGPCATLPAIHFKNCNVIHLGFTADEIAILAAGGSFQLAIWQDTMPVLTPSVEEWPNQRFDDDGHAIDNDSRDSSGNPLIEWAVARWKAECEHRPLQNIYRRSIDNHWRQVIKWAGGDPGALLGPSHDERLSAEKPDVSKLRTEDDAKLIYTAMRYAAEHSRELKGNPAPEWAEGGNGLMQDEARRVARKLITGE